jgi:hypothetical protein
MNFESKTLFKSPTFPGVSVKLRKLSHGARVRIDMAVAPARAKIRDFSEEMDEIRETINANVDANLPEDERLKAAERAATREDRRRLQDLGSNIQRIVYSEIEPAYLREAVKEILHFTIDGEPCTTVDALLEDGPQELVKEIYDEIQAGVLGLSGDERKN